MERIVERGGGLDVHRDTIAACVRVPGASGRADVRDDGGGKPAGPAGLAGGPRGDTRGDGEHGRVLETRVLRPRRGGHVPARQRRPRQAGPRTEDRCAGLRLARAIAGAGLLRGSFVPPAPIRELRDLTRYRKVLIEERSREANRLHKVLQDADIKLASVARDILGVSGRAMLAPWSTAPRIPRCWRTWRAASSAASGRRCARPWRGASAPIMRFSSASCWPTWTTWTRPSRPERAGGGGDRPFGGRSSSWTRSGGGDPHGGSAGG